MGICHHIWWNRHVANMSPSVALTTGEARWEYFPHAADVGGRGFGRSTAEAFEQAALALTAVITQPTAPVWRR